MKTQLFTLFKKSTTLVAAIICSASLMISQNTSWVVPIKPGNSASGGVIVNDVEIDASGNIFTTGIFKGTVNFNFNGTATNATSAGGYDIFVARYTSAGLLTWVKTIGGTADDIAVALDLQGTGVAIGGTFVSTNVDFDPGTGTNVLSSSGLTDIFVAMFDNNGNHVWAKRSGGTQGELLTDIEFDNSANVYIAGSFATINDFFSNTNTITNGARDAFLCKLDASGNYQWVKVIGGVGTDVSNRLSIAGSLVFLCSDIGSGSTTFDSGSGTLSGTFSGTGTNGILSAFNTSGVYQNSAQFKGNTHAVKYLYTGSVAQIIGSFKGSIDVDPGAGAISVSAVGANDMFIVELNGFSNALTYVRHFICNGTTATSEVNITDVKIFNLINSGDLYIGVSGYGKGGINFGGTSTADVTGFASNDFSFLATFHHNPPGLNYSMGYGIANARVQASTDASRGNCFATTQVTSNANIVVGGTYFSNDASPNPTIFDPGNVGGTTGGVGDPGVSTATMGYLQYINSCSVPNTVAATNDYTICAGSTVTLSASGATTYSWNTGSTATSFTVTPTTTTTYTLTGTNTGGCVKTDTVKITVTPVPNVIGVSNDFTTCAGTAATLSATGATTYSWNTGATTASTSVSPTTTTTYTVTGTSSGCSKTDTVKITVSPGPNTIASANDFTVCSGTAVTLSGSGATTYSWNTGATGSTTSVTPTATTTYTLTGTTNGCSKTDTAKVTVYTTIVATNPDFNCGPGVVTLGATPSGGTVQWFAALTGGNALATGTSFTTPTISATTTYYVQVNNNGCVSASRTAVVATIKTIPTIPSGTDKARCGAGTVTMTATPGSIGSIFWYTSPTSTSPVSTSGSYTTPSISTNTTYYAETASGGCYSPRLPLQAIIQSAAPTSAPTNTTPGANLTICGGNTTTLTATGVSLGTIKWWTASTGGTLLFTGNSYTTPTLSANTTYYAEDNNSCGASARTAITVAVGASAAPPTNTTTVANICSGNTATVSASASGTIKWYTASTGGTLLFTGASYTTPILTATTTYYAENNSTCGTSARTAVTINIVALPTVTASTTTYSICSGASVTLSGIGATNYSWNTGATTASISVSPTSTTTYTLTGSTAGCSATDTVKVTVKNLPSTVASTNTYTICNGSSATLAASGASTYSWNTGSTATSLIVTPTTTTTYTLTGNGSNGCSKTDTVKITVNAVPNTIASANNYSICNGATATLSASGATTYSWNTGSALTTFTVSPTATTTYTLTGTTAGCSKSDTVKINVNTISLVVSPPSATICQGSGANAIFTASGANTYTWTSGPTTASYTVTPTTNTTYTVTGTSAQGCTQTATALVSVSSGAVLTISPSNPIVCTNGGAVTLSASGANTYTWSNGPATDTYSVNPIVSNTYTVTGTATGGCTGTATVTVNVSSPPAITASATNATVCEGSSTTIIALNADSYLWNTNETTSSINVTPTTSTTYTVTGTSQIGCSATTTVTVNVNQVPSASITVNEPLLTAVEVGAIYQWFDCNLQQAIGGENGQSYTATSNGDYGVLVTKNGCADTSSCVAITTVGIKENVLENAIQIFPNPASTHVSLVNTSAEIFNIELADFTGKVIYTTALSNKMIDIDLSTYANGFYLVKSATKNTVHIQKLIINQ